VEIRKVTLIRVPRNLLFLLILFLSFVASGFAEDKSFFWKVESEKSTVYLLGSIHLATEDLYPLPEKIEKAYEKSDFLVVEVNLNNVSASVLQQSFMKKALYPPGKTLKTQISKKVYAATAAELTQLGLKIADFDQYEPWFVAMFMTTLKLQKLGYNPDFGIDRHFLDAAADQKKKIQELETAAFQIDLLDEFSKTNQELFLYYTVTDLEKVEEYIDQLMNAWSHGDSAGLQKLLFLHFADEPELKPIFDALFTSRNKKMAEKISSYLKGEGRYFVVVGAGHLVGDDGLISLLQKQGFTVQQQ